MGPSTGDLERLRRALSRLSDRLRLATLFGSMAEGAAGPMSDVDVAVLPREGIDRLELVSDLLESVTGALGVTEDRVDILFLDSVESLPLLYRAVVRGIPLYCESRDLRANIRDRVLSQYLDFAVFLGKMELGERFRRALSRWLDEAAQAPADH